MRKIPANRRFREFGWNGIRFTAPGDWDVKRIGPSYLLLENRSEPVMEMKWGAIRGRFSHRKQLRRLDRGRRNPRDTPVKERPLPAEWEKALARYDTRCFDWKETTGGGTGLTVYCPECRNAALIQFFRNANTPSFVQTGDILSSFRDHPRSDRNIWSIYDFRAEIPAEFRLKKYRFDAGAFALKFESGNRKIGLYRWAPAAVLMKKETLETLAATWFHLPQTPPEPFCINGDNGLQWRTPVPDRLWGRMAQSLRPGYRFKGLRMWHITAKNRILGVEIEGKSPVNVNEMEALSTTYENT